MAWNDLNTEPADAFVNDDTDAGVLNEDIDYDGAGQYMRRFDEPDADWAIVYLGKTTWSPA